MHTQSMALRGGRVGAAGEMLETTVKWVTEWPAALLVVVEIGLLLANLTYRYALHDPLTWGDELASVLFIWLAMFGAVIALRRGEHADDAGLARVLAPREKKRERDGERERASGEESERQRADEDDPSQPRVRASLLRLLPEERLAAHSLQETASPRASHR